eukprot:TRINITY_DN655_c0_g1_i1.p1 TRINITY_DN655_c0_g1~~TRINITY_DN655_c0_g1_i1.p1  ORF type:complete len:264 (+),score=58.75 TRINITY_DN655_c0_g1_i1:472-1263(+)
MESPLFQVNFPLSNTPSMFSMLPRTNSFEDCFRAIPPVHYAPITTNEFFTEDDVLSPGMHFFSNSAEFSDGSDSDLDSDPLRANSPTEEMLKATIPIIERRPIMEKFPLDKVSDFKHVIYNLLVDHHNDPELVPFIEPVSILLDGEQRTGFRFPETYAPEKKLPELYAQHIRRARLDLEHQDSIFIQDLYKFYLRAVLELLAKYFEKCDKYTFLDDDAPLFIPGTSIKEAEARMKTMRTRARKRKSAQRESKKTTRKQPKREW